MSKQKTKDVMGLHRIKNKVQRNAFDLSHRHMFTANIGELLPVFVQWVNPNETFKIGYNGMTRTQPLQTAAFTRLRENVQFYFVPFASLWKYFEQSVNNMTVGQSGENISKVAASSTQEMSLSTKMPYINYESFKGIIGNLLEETLAKIYEIYSKKSSYPSISGYAQGSYNWYMYYKKKDHHQNHNQTF